MKIEKLTDDKIRIIVNSSDLENYKLDAKTIFSKAMEHNSFFINLLEKAKNEVGFDSEGCRLLIEAFSTSEEYLVFTITKYSDSRNHSDFTLRAPKAKRKSINYSAPKLFYEFPNFETFCELCEYINKNQDFIPKNLSKKSSLYLYKDRYFLTINSTGISPKIIKDFCTITSEFLSPRNFSACFANKLLEHGRAIIKTNAINSGIKYFVK